jgi:DTW domain-containing protein
MEHPRQNCWQCYRPENACLCSHITKFKTKTHFVILMHPKEFKREKNATGKLTHASLVNSEIIWDLDFTHHPRVNELIEDKANYCVLLYPGEAKNLSKGEFVVEDLKEKRLVVFLLDGTWACAKKMLKLSSNLQKLERLMFTPTQKSEFYIKHQPHEWCLSTIETVFQFLESLSFVGLEENKDWKPLLIPFYKLQEYQVSCSLDPSRQGYRRGSYKKPEERPKRRAERLRKLFF